MEVMSFFISDVCIKDAFDEILYGSDTLTLYSKDGDTAYFRGDNNSRIYYHYLFNDVEREFSYNYSKEDIALIVNYFGLTEFFLFDVSYNAEELMNRLLDDFEQCLLKSFKGRSLKVVISHPFKGIKCFFSASSDWS